MIIIPQMRKIPAGRFMMGSALLGQAERMVEVRQFMIGTYPITNLEYRSYLLNLDMPVPDILQDPEFFGHPVVNILFSEAEQYCQYLGERLGKVIRLPSACEWEYAARGPRSLSYPWGNELDISKAVIRTSGTRDVHSYLYDVSPFGVRHMAGNVSEWTSGIRISTENPEEPYRVLKGGSWMDVNTFCLLSAYLNFDRPRSKSPKVGFRILQEL
ncbi:MAG: SUMF1/EgtB/PvdO family nonheme iron enzyme [Candidatus Margulisiibacteriota bacterium]